MKKVNYINGYKVIYKPEHPNAMKNSNWEGFIYEHRYIASKILGRALMNNEDVHHLDLDSSNNHPNNLLILDSSQHTKFHNWLNNFHKEKKTLIYCIKCNEPIINGNTKFCSAKCSNELNTTAGKPSKVELEKLILDINNYSEIGRMFGVSPTTVRRWKSNYNI